MTIWLRLCCLVCLCLGIGATEVSVSALHPALRPGLPLRIAISLPNAGSGPRVVSILVMQEDVPIARQHIEIDDAAQLLEPMHAFIIPTQTVTPQAARIEVVIEGGPGDAVHGACSVPTWPQQLNDIAQLAPRVQNQDGLPRLLLEQAAMLAERPPTLAAIIRLGEITTALTRWIDTGQAPPPQANTVVTWAITCTRDRSVHPLLISAPAEQPHAVVHVLEDPNTTTDKIRWKSHQRDWLAAAQRANLAVIMWYPAGDHSWDDIAGQRFQDHYRDVVTQAGWDETPQFIIATGSAHHGARQLLGSLPQLRGLIAVEPTAPAQPNLTQLGANERTQRWLRLRRNAPSHLLGMSQAVINTNGTDGPTWTRNQTVAVLDSTLAADKPWLWITAQATMPSTTHQQLKRVFAEPGQLGPLMIQTLNAWGEPGEISLTRSGESAWDIKHFGISSAQWQSNDPVNWPNDLPTSKNISPAKQLGNFCGPLDAYHRKPFVVVVGRSGDLATNERNRRTAQAFLDDWTAHSHGAAAWTWDDEFVDRAWSNHYLVLIGSPNSNAVSASLAQLGAFPDLTVTHRTISLGDHSLLTSQPYGCGLAAAHPTDPTRGLVLLTGDPWWQRNPAWPPLSGTPDAVLCPLAGYTDNTGTATSFSALTDNQWVLPRSGSPSD